MSGKVEFDPRGALTSQKRIDLCVLAGRRTPISMRIPCPDEDGQSSFRIVNGRFISRDRGEWYSFVFWDGADEVEIPFVLAQDRSASETVPDEMASRAYLCTDRKTYLLMRGAHSPDFVYARGCKPIEN